VERRLVPADSPYAARSLKVLMNGTFQNDSSLATHAALTLG